MFPTRPSQSVFSRVTWQVTHVSVTNRKILSKSVVILIEIPQTQMLSKPSAPVDKNTLVPVVFLGPVHILISVCFGLKLFLQTICARRFEETGQRIQTRLNTATRS